MNAQPIIDALLWPVNDIPRIFEVGTRGFGPAIPALVELGIVAGMLLIQPFPGKSAPAEIGDVALAYGAAAGASFLLKSL